MPTPLERRRRPPGGHAHLFASLKACRDDSPHGGAHVQPTRCSCVARTHECLRRVEAGWHLSGEIRPLVRPRSARYPSPKGESSARGDHRRTRLESSRTPRRDCSPPTGSGQPPRAIYRRRRPARWDPQAREVWRCWCSYPLQDTPTPGELNAVHGSVPDNCLVPTPEVGA